MTIIVNYCKLQLEVNIQLLMQNFKDANTFYT